MSALSKVGDGEMDDAFHAFKNDLYPPEEISTSVAYFHFYWSLAFYLRVRKWGDFFHAE